MHIDFRPSDQLSDISDISFYRAPIELILYSFEEYIKQDQGSKTPSTSPFHQLKIELTVYRKHFVSIPNVLELLKS